MQTTTQISRQHIAGEVRAGLARQRMTQQKLADAIGISRPTLSSRLTCESAFNTDELFAISLALNISFANFWPKGDAA